MKKLIFIFVSLFTLIALSGCGSTTHTEANGRKLIMAYDKLYAYEGEFDEDDAVVMGDSGLVGGIITSTVWEEQIPSANGQTNFGQLGSYYSKVSDNSDEIEVFIEEKNSWYSFCEVK